MKPSFIFALALVSFSHICQANPGQPVAHLFSKNFLVSLRKGNSLWDEPVASSKICSCQILRVESNNAPAQFIAVFAQGTQSGDLTAHLNQAADLLEKEKKHLQTFFFSKVKTLEKLSSESPCNQLYQHFKSRYEDLRLYDVLDADALSHLSNHTTR